MPVGATGATATPTSPGAAWLRSIGAAALLLLINFVLGQVFKAIAALAGLPASLQVRTAVLLASTMVGELLFFAVLVVWLRRQRCSLDDLGWRRRPPAWAVVSALLFGVAYGGLTLTNPGLRPFLGILQPLKAEAAVAVLIAAFVEEVAFRGYVMLELRRAGLPVAVQILASGAIFGAAHFNYSLPGAVSAFVIGSVFALIYVFGRRSLIPVIAGHAVVDLIIEPALIMWVLAGFPSPR